MKRGKCKTCELLKEPAVPVVRKDPEFQTHVAWILDWLGAYGIELNNAEHIIDTIERLVVISLRRQTLAKKIHAKQTKTH